MRFQVPQFIEVEDKIFGPLTFKQFIYLGGGFGFLLMANVFLPLFLAILVSAPIIAFAAALAFYKVNDRPFVHIVRSAINYAGSSKLYIWKKKQPKPKKHQKQQESTAKEIPFIPKLSESKLKDLAWSLDIKESIYAETQKAKRPAPTKKVNT